jgi:hypothetical protein
MKFVGGIHVAVAKVELHHVGWQAVGPILCTGFLEGMH